MSPSYKNIQKRKTKYLTEALQTLQLMSVTHPLKI